MTRPSWVPHTAWLSFTELDKAVVHVIRLASCLWLLFQSVCPLMPSLSAYHLTSVSPTLDVGYLFMAAPAKCSRCSWFFKPGLRNTCTVNFQMFKMVLEKAEEPEIKLPTSAGSSKKQEHSRKTSISALLTMPKPLTVWITINCKILKQMGIADHLTCFLRHLSAGQEATVRTGHGTADWFQIGKGVCQGCILSPCLFNLYAEYIMRNAGLEEVQAGIKTAGRNVNNLRYHRGHSEWHLPDTGR